MNKLISLFLVLGSFSASAEDASAEYLTRICKRNSTDAEVDACFFLVESGKVFPKAAVSLCTNRTRNWNLNGCLASVADGQFDDRMLRICKSLQRESAGLIGCINAINGAEFQPEAVTFCRTVESRGQLNTCFTTIRNKEYSEDEIRSCRKFRTDAGMIRCLSESGS
jgi:hypothetical protein